MAQSFGSIPANVRKVAYHLNAMHASSNGLSTSAKKRKAKGKARKLSSTFSTHFFPILD
jgi:hypothetical protein